MIAMEQPAQDPAPQAAILAAGAERAKAALGKPVRLQAKTLRTEGDWAFLLAAMQDPHGRPVSYVGTARNEAASQGFLSTDYAALLRREGAAWTVVTEAVGPTDVAWAGWAAKHGAPETLFPR